MAMMARHLNRKGDPVPGHQKMWEGRAGLSTASRAYGRNRRLNRQSLLVRSCARAAEPRAGLSDRRPEPANPTVPGGKRHGATCGPTGLESSRRGSADSAEQAGPGCRVGCLNRPGIAEAVPHQAPAKARSTGGGASVSIP